MNKKAGDFKSATEIIEKGYMEGKACETLVTKEGDGNNGSGELISKKVK